MEEDKEIKIKGLTDEEPITKGRLLIKIIDWTLIIALIIVVLYFGIKGHYIDTKIIETCNGQPITQSINWNLT